MSAAFAVEATSQYAFTAESSYAAWRAVTILSRKNAGCASDVRPAIWQNDVHERPGAAD
jgi:hypothetical protein